MVAATRPTLSLAEVRERQQREQAALAALGLSGRADEAPLDIRRLAVIVADLAKRKPK
jgi:hypothetical protein